MRPQILVALLLAALVAGTPAGALAITVSWDFSGGLDTANFTYYTYDAPTVTVDYSGGEVRLSKPEGGSSWNLAGIGTNFVLSGDFDVRVDYKIYTPSLNYGVFCAFDNSGYSLVRNNESATGGQNYHVWDGYFAGITPTGDNAGTLRWVRTGSTIHAFYKSPGATDWTNIYNAGAPTGDSVLQMHFFNNPYVYSYAAYDGAFDNLYINADALPGYVVPLPASVWLLGSGLAGLAAWRKKRS